MKEYQLFIDNEWREGGNGTLDIINPALGTITARVANANTEDLNFALASAQKGHEVWRQTPPKVRGSLLLRAADILESKIDTAAIATCHEQGKSAAEASGEFIRALETLRWSGEMAAELCAPIIMGGNRTMLPEPIGVVAAFTPWNYPAVISARKLAPALAAGCAVILKAAEESPASAVAIIEALQEAGIPAGVVGLIFGHPPMISKHLLSSKIVRTVTFTGSTQVGKQLAEQAAKNLQSCILELGGHAPVIIFDDADIQKTAELISEYKFESAGQSCNAPSRIFVQRPIYNDFVSAFKKVAKAIVVGNSEDKNTTMGPMIGQRAIDRMQRLTDDAILKGATVILGGAPLKGPGYFWPPTLISNVPSDALILIEEPFGPIIPIIAFDNIEEVTSQANKSNYGLASYIFTKSEDTQRKVIDQLHTGSVTVNMLMGVRADVINPGIKDSGYGYEGGIEGFRAFQTLKLVNNASATTFLHKG
ncbi:MAG: NAD-dependent succinate-semialdehyde dehydrogenase [Alphaproteobacteria bacterium]|nr:MAG: NAD-dependent succinate-semialdehyde dehydrogenase [Alphaproteobacteria bacterium]